MREQGFAARSLGPDGPKAWAEARRFNDDWAKHQKGIPTSLATKTYPIGSMGHAWQRYRKLQAWADKKPRTREEWDSVWNRWIEPIFGDVDPKTVQVENIEDLRHAILKKISLHAAHRLIKIWRAFWQVMASMDMCQSSADPSFLFRNKAPKGRSATWKEIEVIKLVKTAWRNGYQGLAALLAVSWDTQFQPGDCRSLTLAMRLRDRRGEYFDTSRGKTGKDVIGTLSRRTTKILDEYLKNVGLVLPADAQIFRNRSGAVYSSDTLGDDFRDVREIAFPGDTRKMMDMRRSGAVEAVAGKVNPSAMAAKMGNSIDQSKRLQETYLPKRAATVRIADAARRRGRKVLKENE